MNPCFLSSLVNFDFTTQIIIQIILYLQSTFQASDSFVLGWNIDLAQQNVFIAFASSTFLLLKLNHLLQITSSLKNGHSTTETSDGFDYETDSEDEKVDEIDEPVEAHGEDEDEERTIIENQAIVSDKANARLQREMRRLGGSWFNPLLEQVTGNATDRLKNFETQQHQMLHWEGMNLMKCRHLRSRQCRICSVILHFMHATKWCYQN